MINIDCIEVLMDEHIYIRRMLKVIHNIAYTILEGDKICFEDFEHILDFIETYVDRYHNEKEEQILFSKIEREIGSLANNLIFYGTIVEHDYARLCILQLREALEKVENGDNYYKKDIVANAVSFANLLDRHINKEDIVVFRYAKEKLTKKVLKNVNEEFLKYQEEAIINNIQHKYIKILKNLEDKYL